MIKAILIDDEKLARNTLRKLLELYCPHVEVIGECEDARNATDMVEQLNPDLVFLDVAMPGKNGIDFLKEQTDISFEVIFVTAHDKYVLQAIRFAAVDYLSKPVEEEQLVTAVANAAKRIHSKSINRNMQTFLHNIRQNSPSGNMQMCIPSVKGFQVVLISDIIYCEAQNTYTYIYLQNNSRILASRTWVIMNCCYRTLHLSAFINLFSST